MDDALAQMFEERTRAAGCAPSTCCIRMLPTSTQMHFIKATPLEKGTAAQGPIADKAPFMEEFCYESDDECLRQPCTGSNGEEEDR